MSPSGVTIQCAAASLPTGGSTSITRATSARVEGASTTRPWKRPPRSYCTKIFRPSRSMSPSNGRSPRAAAADAAPQGQRDAGRDHQEHQDGAAAAEGLRG
eukprot:9513744-Lingulodinium_polyedra.AAC.1